jgi:thiopeptide-type bacteriocin biosynthesis protein
MSDEWIALHVFYASDANPIIAESIRPLVAELRDEQLIDGWFFIKYWMEGPHVRLRLHPADPARRDEVETRARTALESFLARRPALYDTDVDGMADLYKKMYIAEYGEDAYVAAYGDGEMPFRANNTVHSMPYERELDRYGGEAGMRLGEWHFERSSDTVAGLIATTNVHVRSVLLGLSAQLSLILAYTFLGSDEKVARFFARYRNFWETSYQERSDDYHDSFDTSFQRTGDTLRDKIARIRTLGDGDGSEAMSGLERQWSRHAAELRDRVDELAASGQLVFPDRAVGRRVPIDDREAMATVLLSSYVHMTNNRLGAAILDEIYLSYLVEKALTGTVRTIEPEPERAAVPA